MKIYMDTEFTGLHKDTSLVSIGLISEDGRKFYMENYDYNKDQVDNWIQENVINNTTYLSDINELGMCNMDIKNLYGVGTKERIEEELIRWFKQFDEVQLVSDVCHYDMVLLIDIFGTAFDLPSNVSPVCVDINDQIANYLAISPAKAFDVSREGLLKELLGFEITGEKHNSLYDARVIKAISEQIEFRLLRQ